MKFIKPCMILQQKFGTVVKYAFPIANDLS